MVSQVFSCPCQRLAGACDLSPFSSLPSPSLGQQQQRQEPEPGGTGARSSITNQTTPSSQNSPTRVTKRNLCSNAKSQPLHVRLMFQDRLLHVQLTFLWLAWDQPKCPLVGRSLLLTISGRMAGLRNTNSPCETYVLKNHLSMSNTCSGWGERGRSPSQNLSLLSMPGLSPTGL
jgi:hypothetical protein